MNFILKHSKSFQHFSVRRINVLMTNKFADPKIDIVFKKLFGNSDILVDFINKVLPTKHIKKVEYIPTNIVPESRAKKQSILDVLCTDENGSKYIVEMQSAKEKGFKKRAVYYGSKTYGSQLEKGGRYSDLLEVIFIAITDFVLFPKKKDYLSIHTIRDTKSNEKDLNELTFVFIELPKYEIHENAQGIDEWIDFFKTASERKTFQTSNPIIKKAYDNLEMSNWTDEEWLEFQAYEKIRLDSEAIQEEFFDSGKAEGRAEVVKNMLKQNLDVDTIFKLTGMSQDEIRSLNNEL
jgi:predicted transposase/invertase (TIGR01784 family)